MRPYKFAVAAAVVAVTAGCSTHADPGASEPAISVGPTITSAARLSTPLASLLPSKDQTRTIDAAWRQLTAQCVAKFSATYTDRPTTDMGPLLDVGRRYGLVDRSTATKLGYGAPPDPNAPTQAKGSGSGWNPTPREKEVVTGMDASGRASRLTGTDGSPVPPNGCASAMWQQLTGGKLQTASLATRVLNDSWAHVLTDSRALAAEHAWSQCMSSAGYNFAHRWDAGQSVAGKPVAQQVPLALKDLDCAEQTNYVAIWFAVDSAYQRQTMSTMTADVEGLRTAKTETLAKAQTILNSAG